MHQNLKKVYENASGKDMAVTDKEFNKAVLDPSNNSYKVLERYRQELSKIQLNNSMIFNAMSSIIMEDSFLTMFN